MSAKKETAIVRVDREVDRILTERPNLCGYVQINFKDGEVANVNYYVTTFKAEPLLMRDAKNPGKRKDSRT